jgi:hypothetical protein
MSASLGYATKQYAMPVPNLKAKKIDTVNLKIIAREVDATRKRENDPNTTSKRWAVSLVIVNTILATAHIGVLVFVLTSTFSFPLTFFHTTIKDSILNNLNCIYDYGENMYNDTTNSFCSNVEYTMTGNSTPPLICTQILSGNDSLPGVTDSGSPLLQAYELTRFGQGGNSVEYIDNIGKYLTQGVLIAIECFTLISHVFYAIIFYRIYNEMNVNKKEKMLTNWFLENGGLPLRWIEYALTASLMSLFIATTANLFEVFGIVAITLSVFAQMFFGGIVERLLSQGYAYESLTIIYIPAFSIFVATWAPIVNSLFTSVFKLSCLTYEEDNFFTCTQPSCFGREVPIPVFSFVLLSLFCVFPIILIYKAYIMGGWFAYIDDFIVNGLRLCTCQPFKNFSLLCYPVYLILLGFIRTLNFIFFIFIAGFIAWFNLLKTVFSPFVPVRFLIETPKPIKSLRVLFVCEALYAMASATSKIFLAVFFTISFANRNW